MSSSLKVLCAAGLLTFTWAAHAASPLPGAAPTHPADVVAQSDSASLSSTDVQTMLASLTAPERSKLASDLPDLEQLIRNELLRRNMLAAAKADGFDRKPETQTQLETLRDSMLVRLWLASKAAVPSDYPSEADVKTAYDSNRQALASPTRYHLAQIYLNAPDGTDPAKTLAALKKAADISTKLTAANFAKMAQDFSEHAESAAKGGDLGYLQENRMIPQIAAAVRTMKTGEVLGPIKTAEGLHFLNLLDKQEAAPPALADVHDQLVSALRSRRATELEQAYIRDLSGQSGITINQIALAKLQQNLK